MLWARLLAYVSGTVDQELLLRNEYLAAENRMCCAKIPFSFEVDRYNGQPANNRLTFIYRLGWTCLS